ncbi:MAG: segregation/condensation protein A [Candidatus Alcyoniella australis]|nr:segregation/condensation protein A [Candidatus Alcyoniella australis]
MDDVDDKTPQGEPRTDESFIPLPGLSEQDRETISVHLEVFEGPLDLLLHLIRKNEYDIFDIPIAIITEQFLAGVELLKQLNLSVAGEFLVMSATLMKIKSKMLLPPSEFDEEDEELDPRAELVRQLLEYQRYKDAAGQLVELPRLGVDVFARKWPSDELDGIDHEEILELNLYDLVEAFGELLRSLPDQTQHTIIGESFKVADKMNQILDAIRGHESLLLREMLRDQPTRSEVIAVFLALLELVKRSLIRLFQAGTLGTIRIFPNLIEGREEDDD